MANPSLYGMVRRLRLNTCLNGGGWFVSSNCGISKIGSQLTAITILGAASAYSSDGSMVLFTPSIAAKVFERFHVGGGGCKARTGSDVE